MSQSDLRLAALDRAVNLHSTGEKPDADAVVQTAERFERYLRCGEAQREQVRITPGAIADAVAEQIAESSEAR